MSTPAYVVKKIGDQYVPVLQEPYPRVSCGAYLFGGSLMCYMGMIRRGPIGQAVMASGLLTLTRCALGYSPLLWLRSAFRRRAPDGKPSAAPSYQNDFPGRAPQQPADEVDEASMESFPASDPPAHRHRDEAEPTPATIEQHP
jgi:hypothetical protein